MNPLELRQVSRVYDMGDNQVVALDRVDLVVRSNEVVMLVGPSGSGKTTLLSIAGGLLSPSEGQVLVGGADISRASGRELTAFRRERVGFIFQSVNLVPFLTARENLLVVAEFAKRDMGQARSRADRLLDELGLGHRLGNLPSQLSGGERQRVAIGRALMNQPALVLVDEPTSALDSKLGVQVMELIVSEVKARGAAAVIVTHDTRMTRYGDRKMAMADGRILAEGSSAASGEQLALPRYSGPVPAGARGGYQGPPSGEWDRYGDRAPESPPWGTPATPAASARWNGYDEPVSARSGPDPRTDSGSWDHFSEPAAVAPSGEWDVYDDPMVASGPGDRYEQPVAGAGSPSRNWYDNPPAAAGAGANADRGYRSPFEDLVDASGEPERNQAPAGAGPPRPPAGAQWRTDPRTGQHRPVMPGPGAAGSPYGRPGPPDPRRPGPGPGAAHLPPPPGAPQRPPAPRGRPPARPDDRRDQRPPPRGGPGARGPAEDGWSPGGGPPRRDDHLFPPSGPPTGSTRRVAEGGPPAVRRNGHALPPPPGWAQPGANGARAQGPAGAGRPPPPGQDRFDRGGGRPPPPGAGRTGAHPAIPAGPGRPPRPPAGRGAPPARPGPPPGNGPARPRGPQSGPPWGPPRPAPPPDRGPERYPPDQRGDGRPVNGESRTRPRPAPPDRRPDSRPPPRYGDAPPPGRRPRGGPPPRSG
jgi:putative ABC transport system ATP-binding protein